jgi:hypothetical protein
MARKSLRSIVSYVLHTPGADHVQSGVHRWWCDEVAIDFPSVTSTVEYIASAFTTEPKPLSPALVSA